MIQDIIVMIIGFVFLIKGADFVVKGAVGISKRLNLSEMLVGIVLVGIGTSLPEIIVTITSSLKGEADIILGNAIGSSICNILFVIGLAGFVRPMKIDKRLCKTHLTMSLLTIIVLYFVCNFGNSKSLEIQRLEAVILLAITVIYTIFTFFEGKNENEENKVIIDEEFSELEREHGKMSYLKIFGYIILGLLGLKFGADFVIKEVTNIVNYFGISPAVVSMTIVAVGTALPEIATSIIATLRKDTDLVMGNVIGSNIYNVCLLIGLGGVINPISYNNSFNSSIIILAIATLIVIILTNFKNKQTITRPKASLLLLLYGVYLFSLFA